MTGEDCHLAVQQATWVLEHRDELDREALVNYARALTEWGCFSNRNVAGITGLRPELVNELSGKNDRTGGRLNPEALPVILEVCQARARNEAEPAQVRAALEAGVSGTLLARLTGIPQRTIANWAKKNG